MGAELQTRTDADANVYAVIRNASALVWNGTTFVTFADADFGAYDVPLTEQGTSSGYYVGDFPAGITTGGQYVVEFFKRAGAQPALSDAFVTGGAFDWDGTEVTGDDTGTNLTSLSYVKDFIGVTADADDAYLTARIRAASAAIIRYCRRGFVLQEFTEYVDGPGSFGLLLPQYPVGSLTSVTLDAYGTTPDVIGGNEYIINRKTGVISLKPSSTACPYFPHGFQNVKVIFTAGFTTVPQDVQDACAQVVSNMYNQRGFDMSITSEKIGDYAVTYGGDTGKLVTADIAATLDRYRDQIA